MVKDKYDNFLIMNAKIWNGEVVFDLAGDQDNFWVTKKELINRIKKVKSINRQKHIDRMNNYESRLDNSKIILKEINKKVPINRISDSRTSDGYTEYNDKRFKDFLKRIKLNKRPRWTGETIFSDSFRKKKFYHKT